MFPGPRITGLGFGLGTDTEQCTLYVLKRRASCFHVLSVPTGKVPSVEDCADRTQRRELEFGAYMPALPVGNYLQNSTKRRSNPALLEFKAYPSPPPTSRAFRRKSPRGYITSSAGSSWGKPYTVSVLDVCQLRGLSADRRSVPLIRIPPTAATAGAAHSVLHSVRLEFREQASDTRVSGLC